MTRFTLLLVTLLLFPIPSRQALAQKQSSRQRPQTAAAAGGNVVRGARSVLALPQAEEALPVVVFLPFTGGSANDFLRGYLGMAQAWDVIDGPEDRQLSGLTSRLFPGGDHRFALMILDGTGSAADYSSGDAWTATIARYEEAITTDLAEYAGRGRIDTTSVILAGYSMGGDLSWAIALRNPTRFAGAFVMGSRASYRASSTAMGALATRGTKFFFTMGGSEQQVRLDGAQAAVAILESSGIESQYHEMAGAGHDPASLDLLAEGLAWLLP